jgi:hypothetical protein
VNEGDSPGSLSVLWSPEARAHLRAIDRRTALDILHCIGRYLNMRNGDVKRLNHRKADFVFVAAIIASFSSNPSNTQLPPPA